MENNKVILSGHISSQMTFSHETHDERFYSFNISVTRQSGTTDVIPVLVSEWLLDCTKDYVGKYIKIEGQFRSFNQETENKHRLVLSVFAIRIDFPEEETEDANEIILDGFVCKNPICRETPFGRIITDLMLAVNRLCKRSDYIPCIAWGRIAQHASALQVGSHVSITGRIQSREYKKENDMPRIAYEVSISALKMVCVEDGEAV